MEKRVLITRWLGSTTQPLPIYDEASVSSARQRVREIGQRERLSKKTIESAALIASELTHNQLAHAKQGYFLAGSVERNGVKGLELTAADIGPGIERPGAAINDELPKQPGSLGAGLSGIFRMADEVEFDNRLVEGSCIVARKFESADAPRLSEFAIMGRPCPGEAVSGDDAIFVNYESGFVAAVADGLGHGPEAREASNRAVELVHQKKDADLPHLVADLHDALVNTRGCVMNVVRFDGARRSLECVSLGDVHSHLYNLREAHFFTPRPFVLGGRQNFKPFRVEEHPAESGSVLVMFTDGLKSRATIKGQLDILRQPAIAIAQHLIETHARPDDDVMVLVARLRA